ncbi:hypothetical protein F2Q68_00001329 [Brassica cretica]|uniref:Uncharacterized protein n=1 Tax=Brassica cretica TaxID=69181 RepID=A0A8S9JCX0_BRACR|nr:hypothetical protein F2Q68_00001329 [Brassica cretica]
MVESGGDWFSNNQPHPQDLQMQQLGSSVPDFLSARSILPAGKQQPTALMRRRRRRWRWLHTVRAGRVWQSVSSEASRGVGHRGSKMGNSEAER